MATIKEMLQPIPSYLPQNYIPSKSNLKNRLDSKWFDSITDFVKANWTATPNEIWDSEYRYAKLSDFEYTMSSDDKTAILNKLINTDKVKYIILKTNQNIYGDWKGITLGSDEALYNAATHTQIVFELNNEYSGHYNVLKAVTVDYLPNRFINNWGKGDLTYSFTHSTKLKVIPPIDIKGAGFNKTYSEINTACVDFQIFNIGASSQIDIFPNLSREVLVRIFKYQINTLEEGTTATLTLGSTLLAKLTDEDKKIATDKGWTLA